MKKMLGISLVAVFAAAPLMASASQAPSFATPITPTDDFATTSYVKGAYNVLAGHVNSKQDKLKSGSANGADVSEIVKTSIATGENEDTASNTALLTEKAVYDAIAAAKQQAISAASGQASAINDLIAGENETLDASIEAGTVVGALNELSGEISSEAQTRASADNALSDRLDTADTNIGNLQTAVNTLNGSASTPNSVEYKINQAISGVNSTTSGLDGRVTSNTNNIATINGKKITYVTTWNDETNTTVTKTISQLPE